MSDVRVQGGSYADALANGRRLLEIDARAAATQAVTLLKNRPASAPALRLLAAALRRLNRPQEAERAELDAVRTSLADPAIAAARRAIQERRRADAEAQLRAIVRAQPEDAAALFLLGELIGQAGAFRQGEALLNRALALAPAYLDARIALANLLYVQSRASEAIPLVDDVLDRQPGHVSTLRFKATLLGQAGDHHAARALYEQLIAANPGILALWISLGDTLRTLGERDASEAAYRQAIALDPMHGNPWWSLAALGAPFSADDVAAMQRALAAAKDADTRFHLHFALARARERERDLPGAFHHYAEGNRIRRAAMPHDPANVTRAVETAERVLTPAFFAERQGWGDPARDPIFILGMPRSGSTLVEQMLSSHPQIEGTAELPIVPILAQTLLADHGLTRHDSYPELLPRVTRAALTALGRDYLDRAQPQRKAGKPFFLDKLPHNWADVGLIRLMLPNARIVDVRRNPLDCCLSNFRLLFAQGHPSAYALDEMAAYYRDYVRMMRHWDAALPGQVHRLIYEDLVDDPGRELRRLLDHLGMEFDPACLDFHNNPRSVATASSEQVRRPLNRDGIGAWRDYEPWLDPLKAALGPLIEDWRA